MWCCLTNFIISMPVCFCFRRFFCFFLWAFSVTIFPLLKLLLNRHQTRRVSKEFKCLEAQLNRMELSADNREIWNISSECKRNPGWTVSIKFAVACTPHNRMEFSADCIEICGYLIVIRVIRFASVCTLHSRNDQTSKKITYVQGWQYIISQSASQESDPQQFGQKQESVRMQVCLGNQIRMRSAYHQGISSHSNEDLAVKWGLLNKEASYTPHCDKRLWRLTTTMSPLQVPVSLEGDPDEPLSCFL